MATGDILKLGTLYLKNRNVGQPDAKLARPTRPWPAGAYVNGLEGNAGNLGDLSVDTVIYIADTDADDAYKMQWVEINEDGKRYLVMDRCYLYNLKRSDLVYQGFIPGKAITIDGKPYKVRLLTGGESVRTYEKFGSTYRGGTLPNEYDRWILNIDNIPGLPVANIEDYNASADRQYLHGNINAKWNTVYATCMCTKTQTTDTYYYCLRHTNHYVERGGNVGETVGFRFVLEELNNVSTIAVTSPVVNQTLHENSTLTMAGNATDLDADDVVTIKYQIDSGTVRNLHSAVSDGTTPINFSKTLTYKDGVLYDGTNAITSVLDKDTPHTVSMWAEDGKGGKSSIITRTFFVVPNRPPSITVNPIAAQSDLINSNIININGAVTDLDNNDVTVTFKINDGDEQQVYQGPPSAFTFNIFLNDLKVGANTVIVKGTDIYNTAGTKTLTINKTHNATAVNTAVARYQIQAPTGSAKSILLWVTRTLGNLGITAEVSLTNGNDAESYVALNETNSAIVNGLREEEFAYQGTVDKEKIILKITYDRTDAAVIDTIKQVSGVLF